MRKILFALSLLVSMSCFSQYGSWQWAVGAGGVGGKEEIGVSIATDYNGNVYTLGYFNGSSITFGSYYIAGSTWKTLFLIKQNSSGSIIWGKAINGGGFGPSPGGISVNKSGDVYITGGFQGFLSIDATNLTTTGSDIFLIKLNNSGNVIWAKNTLKFTSGMANAVCTNAVGDVFITGTFESDSITFGNTTLVNLSNVPGGQDVFIVKYDSYGNVLWANSASGNQSEHSTSISADSLGNAYIIGNYWSSNMLFDSIVITNSVSNLSTSDIFVAKFNTFGSCSWAKTIGNSSLDFGKDIKVDDKGNIFATGGFSGLTVSFNGVTMPGNGSCANTFLIKFDTNCNVIWTKSFPNQNNNIGCGIEFGVSENIYLTGEFYNTFSIGGYSATSVGAADVYITKLDKFGNVISVLTAGGSHHDNVNSISIDAYDNCYITGFFMSPSVVFGNNILTNNDSTGVHDIFIAKYGLGTTSNNGVDFKKEMIDIYPNPTQEKIIIENDLSNQIQEIRIIDITGKTVKKVSENLNSRKININISDIARGIYFVDIDAANGKLVKKIVID